LTSPDQSADHAAVLVCLDVDYRPAAAVAAAVAFLEWTDASAAHEVVHRSAEPPADYQPGQFYRRELPHLQAVLALLPEAPRIVVVDGFVWLEGETPGLGAHLHQALGGGVAVVGVAKRPYRLANQAVPVLRGESQVALWVTAVGIAVEEAADAVRGMHGEHRMPTLLKRVDRLARDS
jgi:deoxyribonuclease V